MTQQDTILALKAQVKRLEKRAGKPDSRRLRGKKPAKHTSGAGQHKGNKKPKPTPTEGPARSWPKPNNINEVKTFNDKQWQWCGEDTGGKCEGWRNHLPSECFGKKRPSNHSNKKPKAKESYKNKKLKVQEATVRFYPSSDDEASSTNSDEE